MPIFLENLLKGRASTSNVIAFVLTTAYCFIVGYDIIVNKNQTAMDKFGDVVMLVVSNVLLIKGVQTNTNEAK